MLRSLIGRVRSRFGSDDNDADTHRFVPSMLDRSVLSAHASGRSDVNRELRDVQEDARELEQHQQK